MKSNYILCVLLAAGLLQSCEKSLQETPKTVISPDEFFKNPSSYESAVTGIYADFPLYVVYTHEMITDLYATPSASAEQALPIYNNQPTPDYYNAGGAWNTPYAVIKNANFILQYLPNAPLDDSKKAQLIAEASFLRGYAFFNLVQLFGDVPLPLKIPQDYNSLRLPRTGQAQVYEQVLKDLLYAEQNLPDKAAQQGRVDKNVATALLARVYLTMAGNPLKQTQYYKDALQKSTAVINSGKYKLMDDYAQVFHNTKYTSESIWEKLYEPGRGSNFLNGSSNTSPGYNPTLVPSNNFMASFSKGDRRFSWGIISNYIKPDKKVLDRPFFQKFVDTVSINRGDLPSQASIPYTVPIIRLAEMYLIAAEAENAINGPANAYSYINAIRKRARMDKNDPTQVPDLSGLSKEQFQQAVWREFDWELHEEGQSWTIMKRTNTFDRIQKQRGASLNVPVGPYNQTWLIPTTEVTNNNIPQNPLYK